MFKVTRGISPIYITEMLQIKGCNSEDTMTLRSDSSKNFITPQPKSRLPNARMLNIWLNIKNNCSMKTKKMGNVMQQPMESCVCDINTSSESILIWSHLLLA